MSTARATRIPGRAVPELWQRHDPENPRRGRLLSAVEGPTIACCLSGTLGIAFGRRPEWAAFLLGLALPFGATLRVLKRTGRRTMLARVVDLGGR